MPYRSIDLQMSIPRTQENGTLQNQLLHKPVVDQTNLEGDTAKRTEQMRAKNSAVEPNGKLNIKDQQQRESHASPKRRKRGEAADGLDDSGVESAAPTTQKHPFKGQHIDISL